MSLQLAAQHLADQGRGPDTTLVHMAPHEVDALQGLARAAGGSLTLNPETGLPEAGFLSSILPMVIGAAAAPFTAGAVNPWTVAALVGGVKGLASGNLKKGLMAGLGAYGGFGLGSALMGAGAAGAAGAGAGAGATSSGGVALSDAASTGTQLGDLGSSAVKFGGETAGAPSLYNIASPAALPAADTGSANAYNLFSKSSLPTSVTSAATSSVPAGTSALKTMAPIDRFAAMGQGVSSFDPIAYAKANPLTAGAAVAPMILAGLTPKEPKEDREAAARAASRGTEYDYDPGATTPFPTSDGEEEQRYFSPRYTPRTTSRFATGGIADGLSSAQSHLGSYSAGGRGRLLRGPGDGVSDSIPATIGGKQPARLADGEFVIPARIVSELGNGSTEAGSKQLYAMMDRIQRARRKTTGKKKVAVNTKAHKLMPA